MTQPPSSSNPYDPSSSEYEAPTTKFGPPRPQPDEPSAAEEDQPTTRFAPPQAPQPSTYGQPAQPGAYGQSPQPATYNQPPQPDPYGSTPPTVAWDQPPQQPGYGQPAQQPYGSPPGYPPQSGPPATPYPTSGAPNQGGGYGAYPPPSGPPGAAPYAAGAGGYPGYPPPPGVPGAGFPPGPPKQSNKGLIIAIVVVGLVLILGACVALCLGPFRGMSRFQEGMESSQGFDPPSSTSAPDLPDSGAAADSGNSGGSGQTVVYELTGDGRVAVSYVDASGDPANDSTADLPWKKELKLPAGLLKTVVAVRTGGGSGEIGCRITIDGQEIAKRSGSGDFATVTCSRSGDG